MKWIPLTQGQIAVVDDEDYEYLSQFKWCAMKRKGVLEYGFTAVRGVSIGGAGRSRNLQMHRLIMGAPKGMDVDHKNHNTLDNRRSNLRVCTHGQNMLNRRIQKNNRSSRFKGVNLQFKPKLQRAYWRATFRGEHLGNFKSEEIAARAYDAAAKAFDPTFVLLNFPEAKSCRM